MRNALTAVRAIGILVGGFLVLAMLPYSETMPPPLSHRFVRSIPLATGAALLIPYRRIRRGPGRLMIGLVLGLSTVYILTISIGGVADYLSGARSWHILPVVAFFSMVGLGNLWAFVQISSQSAPTSSGQRRTAGSS